MDKAKIFKYQHDDHSIAVAADRQMTRILVDGVPVEDKRVTNILRGKQNITLESGDVIDVQAKYVFSPLPYNVPQGPNQYDHDGSLYELSVKVNGQQLHPLDTPKPIRNIDSMRQLSESYHKIGDLSDKEFLALRKIAGCDIVSTANLNAYVKVSDLAIPHQSKALGVPEGFVLAQGQSIAPGDTVVLTGDKDDVFRRHTHEQIDCVKSLSCTTNPSILDHAARTNGPLLLVDGGDVCVTNIRFGEELKNWQKLIDQGRVSVDAIKELIPADATQDEFHVVKELNERNIMITEPLLEELAKGATVDEALISMSERSIKQTDHQHQGIEINDNDAIEYER